MNRIVCNLGLIGAMMCLAWTQETAPTAEQLRQQLEQMRQEHYELWLSASRAREEAERRHLSGQWKRPLDLYLASAPFPMPPTLSTNHAASPLYVQVEQVRRIDAQVLRHYPESHADFPFYEVKVRILNTWGGYTNEDPNHYVHIPLRLRAGQQIRLLWAARRPIEGDLWMDEEEREKVREAQRRTQIWEVGRRYLLFGVRGFALDAPEAEQEKLSDLQNEIVHTYAGNYERWFREVAPLLPPLDKFLFLVGELWLGAPWQAAGGHAMPPAGIQGHAYTEPSFCSRVPYWVLADPPKELLQFLDEECVVLRYSSDERRQWVSQRVRDSSLPLWKKQRALLYLPDRDLEQPERYLQWLQGLEPPLRAFGLQRFEWTVARYFRWQSERMSLSAGEGQQSWIARALEALQPFLAAEQPVEVRREAAWLIANELMVLQRITDWEKQAKLGLAWWQQRRDCLMERSQAETDEVTRWLLKASWRQIVVWEHRRQMDEVLQQLRALERTHSQ